MTRRGRPMGIKSRSIVEALQVQPRTVREVAQDLQISFGDAFRTVSKLRARGYLTPALGDDGQPVRVPTATRPADVLTVSAPADQGARAAEWHLVMGLMIRSPLK